ncbi:hypothetical protein, partial [Nocardia sp. NPDC057668]|uniref:hypothetical protein n=1 Tax=Nocardia sp. NPDC057668 TaxID=3346202 RepID=UPI00366EC357
MNSGRESTAAQGALALGAAAETLLEAPLYSMSDDEVIELMQDIETITRQLDAAKQRLVLECGTR